MRHSSSGCGTGGSVRGDDHRPAPAPRSVVRLPEERFTLDEAYAAPSCAFFVPLFDRGRSTATTTWSTGIPEAGRRSPTSRSRSARSTTRSTRSPTRSPTATANWSSRPCARRRCSPTPRSRCTRTTSATPDLVGRRSSCRSSGGALPVIADDYVEPEFGTGALKITPGHDPNDFEIGRRHGLEELTVIGQDGRMNEDGRRVRGADASPRRGRPSSPRSRREGALRGRRALHPRGALLAPLGRADRAADLAAVVLRMDELARPAIEARAGRARALPPRVAWRRVYRRLDGAASAPGASRASSGGATSCPSVLRRRARRPTVAETAPDACAECGTAGSRQDDDVLDTWFSCALWPFATLGWPDETPDLRAFYPTDALSPPARSSSSGSRG